MGRRGPKRTPTPILKLRGSELAAKREAAEAAFEVGAPRMPEWLHVEAKRCWRHVVGKLEAAGVLATVDRNALAIYCQTWARWRAAVRFVERNGESFTIHKLDRKGRVARDENGDPVVDRVGTFPESVLATRLAALLDRIGAKFGLTPADRSSLATPVGHGGAGGGEKGANKSRFFARRRSG